METTRIDAVLKFIAALEKLDIPYAISGSFASSIHGMPRSTNDADVIALIKPEKAMPLALSLQDDFYADEQTIERAVRSRRSFNIMFLDTMFKIDVFVASETGFDAMQLSRRKLEVLQRSTQQTAYVTSAEDTMLAKLVWYRKGNEVSDRQWQDVLEIARAQADNLDIEYLKKWAQELGVTDLLERLLMQA